MDAANAAGAANIVTALRDIKGSYFDLLCADVIGCIAEYLRFIPDISETSCIVFNNDQNTSYFPAALDVNGDVIAVMTNNKRGRQICRVDIATGMRTDLTDIKVPNGAKVHNNITGGIGWVNNHLNEKSMICLDEIPYHTVPAPNVSVNNIMYEYKSAYTHICIGQHILAFKVSGQLRRQHILDCHRCAVIVDERDQQSKIYVANEALGKIEVCICVPYLDKDGHITLAKCGDYWIMMQISQRERTSYRVVSVYDILGTHITNIQIPEVNKRITKLMAHPTKPIFAVYIRGSRMLHTYSIDEGRYRFA